ncbi:TolB family protein, partial [Actinomadura sp. BRA 177]|uniref:TolB family protein n=1 Tax=Actinomadura sp. BRA 177 TaxID=2745202 RepID=UPI0034D96DE6
GWGVAGGDAADPGVTSRDTPSPAPAPVPEPVTRPVDEQPTAHVPPAPHPYFPPPPERSRRTTLIASSVAGVLVAGLVAGGVYYLTRPSGEAGNTGAKPAAFPSGPLLVRIDTEPGWPKTCHADIGLFTPGNGSVKTLVRGDTCDVLPERSPDGKLIAFTRSGGGASAAWVMNADGSGVQKVTDIAGGRVTWSPDGTRLAYMGRQDGAKQIFTITLQDHKVTQLTRDDSAKDDPMWSSTGKLVFWSKRDGTEQIYTLDPNDPGGAWKKLTSGDVRSVDPEWSPDGSKIAFTRGASDNSAIWTMNADGSAPSALTSGGEHDMDPAWSKDGHWICYARGATTDPVLHAVRADGTDDKVLTPPDHVLGHPNWS